MNHDIYTEMEKFAAAVEGVLTQAFGNAIRGALGSYRADRNLLIEAVREEQRLRKEQNSRLRHRLRTLENAYQAHLATDHGPGAAGEGIRPTSSTVGDIMHEEVLAGHHRDRLFRVMPGKPMLPQLLAQLQEAADERSRKRTQTMKAANEAVEKILGKPGFEVLRSAMMDSSRLHPRGGVLANVVLSHDAGQPIPDHGPYRWRMTSTKHGLDAWKVEAYHAKGEVAVTPESIVEIARSYPNMEEYDEHSPVGIADCINMARKYHFVDSAGVERSLYFMICLTAPLRWATVPGAQGNRTTYGARLVVEIPGSGARALHRMWRLSSGGGADRPEVYVRELTRGLVAGVRSMYRHMPQQGDVDLGHVSPAAIEWIINDVRDSARAAMETHWSNKEQAQAALRSIEFAVRMFVIPLVDPQGRPVRAPQDGER